MNQPPASPPRRLPQEALTAGTEIAALLGSLREVIQSARRQALHAVDVVQLRTYWSVGRHIVEFEQGGAARAAYGKRVLAGLVREQRLIEEQARREEGGEQR